MGSFYSGFGWGKSYLGYCKDGSIYNGNGNLIGSYKNGSIYNHFKEYIGSYSGGSICDAFGTHIASYDDNGIVYNKYSYIAFEKKQIGSFDTDPAEAAALVLLFLGGDAVNHDNNTTVKENTSATSNTTTYSSNSTSEGIGIIEAILFSIGAILKFLICIVFVYIFIPMAVSSSLIMYVLIPLASMLPFPIALIIHAAFVICIYTFIPYWIMAIIHRVKKRITTKETLTLFLKWFLKGPFAYKDIISIKNKFKKD